MWSRRIGLVLLIILNLLGLLFYNNYIFVMGIVLLIVLPIISLIIMKISLHKISITVHLEKTSIGKNIPVDVSFDVQNNSIMPIENFKIDMNICNMFYENDRKYKIVVPVNPISKRMIHFPVESQYSGRLKIEIVKYTGNDLLGIFSFKIPCSENQELFVLPDYERTFENIGLSLTGNSQDEELQFVKGDDVSQISEIRDYIPGDKLENIHWKLSAKKEELQVKEYSMPYSDEVTILLETSLNQDTPFIFDKIVDTYFAISNSFIKERRKFNVTWFDEKTSDMLFMKISNEDELMESLRELYYCKISAKKELSYQMYQRLSQTTGIITLYITTNDNAQIAGNIIATNGKAVIKCLS